MSVKGKSAFILNKQRIGLLIKRCVQKQDTQNTRTTNLCITDCSFIKDQALPSRKLPISEPELTTPISIRRRLISILRRVFSLNSSERACR